MNYLLVIALQQLSEYYQEDFKVEFPTGSGNKMSLTKYADELSGD